jgi:hypothetical protein
MPKASRICRITPAHAVPLTMSIASLGLSRCAATSARRLSLGVWCAAVAAQALGAQDSVSRAAVPVRGVRASDVFRGGATVLGIAGSASRVAGVPPAPATTLAFPPPSPLVNQSGEWDIAVDQMVTSRFALGMRLAGLAQRTTVDLSNEPPPFGQPGDWGVLDWRRAVLAGPRVTWFQPMWGAWFGFVRGSATVGIDAWRFRSAQSDARVVSIAGGVGLGRMVAPSTAATLEVRRVGSRWSESGFSTNQWSWNAAMGLRLFLNDGHGASSRAAAPTGSGVSEAATRSAAPTLAAPRARAATRGQQGTWVLDVVGSGTRVRDVRPEAVFARTEAAATLRLERFVVRGLAVGGTLGVGRDVLRREFTNVADSFTPLGGRQVSTTLVLGPTLSGLVPLPLGIFAAPAVRAVVQWDNARSSSPSRDDAVFSVVSRQGQLALGLGRPIGHAALLAEVRRVVERRSGDPPLVVGDGLTQWRWDASVGLRVFLP